MKKLFYNIISWFKSLFKKDEDIKENVDEVNDVVVEKTLEEVLFEKLKEQRFFEDGKPSRDQINADLAESARKQNTYKDMYNSIKGFEEPSEKLKGQINAERAKDKTTLIRQQIKAKK